MEVVCAAVLPFLVIFGILALAIGGGALWSRRLGRKWEQSARSLGLSLEPFRSSGGLSFEREPSTTQRMVGSRGNVDVVVGMRVVIVGSGRNRRRVYYTYADARLPRSLGLGLTVFPLGAIQRAMQALTGQSDIQIGIPLVDAAYEIRAAEPETARALLTLPYVAEPLAMLRDGVFGPQIHDTGIRCEQRGRIVDARILARAVDTATELARRIAAARQQIGPSAIERTLEAWRAVAQSRGWALDAASATISGRLEGVAVEARVDTRANQRFTVFEARFDRPLGLGFSVQRQQGLVKIASWLGSQDIEVGEPAFDARFVVKGTDVAAVRALLTADVRGYLISLSDHAGTLSVMDDRLVAEVGYLVSEGGWVESGLSAVARTAAALAKVAPIGAGPYRGG